MVYLTSFTVFSGDKKKSSGNEKNKKNNSENDQLTGHFQNIFFFVPPTLNLNFFPVNQLIKNSGLTVIKMGSSVNFEPHNIVTMSAGQYFKYCQILTHVLTATESHDSNMDFRLFYNGFKHLCA